MHKAAFSMLILAATCPALFGQTTNLAPGGPGNDAHWASAAKNGFGTANSVRSTIWFTLNAGVLTEVFYPTLDVPNVQTLSFVLCTAGQCFDEREMDHRLVVLDDHALLFQQRNIAPHSTLTISKTYATDPNTPTLLIDVQVNGAAQPFDTYVVFDPSLNNSGMHDTGWSTPEALLALDASVCSAVIASGGFSETSNGFLGTSDGLAELKSRGRLVQRYSRAERGNVVQLAKLNQSSTFTVALSFGKTPQEATANANASLRRGFAEIQRAYRAGWHNYVRSLQRVPARYQRQFNTSVMVLKALEDKKFRGAMIASPSSPWGGGPNANEPTTTGYHAVWSRDLYHVATAFLAAGDPASAHRALNYLFRVQQRSDGSFPQNSRVDGREIGSALQMDQVALPLILAYQLRRVDPQTWRRHLKPAADFILRKGPATEQERWEEEKGYSPSTIASEIAALVCAAHIARINRDVHSSNSYLEKADEWARRIDDWTFTKTGPHGEKHYYLRISEDDDPNDGAQININSGGGDFDERAIVDTGFLELVRLGIKAANDPLILKSLNVIDRLIKVDTPYGAAWYRYNHDAYGEREDGASYDGRTGRGRLWTLLTGERGQYELARGDREGAIRRLESLMAFANEGRMIPEQIWDREVTHHGLRLGEGTGSATPLAWSMAQFIRLAVNIRVGRNLDTPKVVAARYLNRN